MKNIFSILLVLIISSCIYQRQSPETITVESPTSVVSTKISGTDSSVLMITANINGYKISLLKDTISLKDSTALNIFFYQNITRLDKEKILVKIKDNSKFYEIKPILKRHGILKFRIITNE